MRIVPKGKPKIYRFTCEVDNFGKETQQGKIHVSATSTLDAKKKVTKKVCKQFPDSTGFRITKVEIES